MRGLLEQVIITPSPLITRFPLTHFLLTGLLAYSARRLEIFALVESLEQSRKRKFLIPFTTRTRMSVMRGIGMFKFLVKMKKIKSITMYLKKLAAPRRE